MNKNVEWMSGTGTKACYLIFIALTWAFFHLSRWFTPEDCWTVTNVIHTVASFTFLHWMKGSPESITSQGDYSAMTVYEQMDASVPYTNTKKFLMLIPALLCWMSCHLADYKLTVCIVNSGMFAICIIPKIPEMHRVRLFGVNTTVGIDDPIEPAGLRRSPRTSKNKLN